MSEIRKLKSTRRTVAVAYQEFGWSFDNSTTTQEEETNYVSKTSLFDVCGVQGNNKFNKIFDFEAHT